MEEDNLSEIIEEINRVKEACQKTGYLEYNGECLAKDIIPCKYKHRRRGDPLVYCSKYGVQEHEEYINKL